MTSFLNEIKIGAEVECLSSMLIYPKLTITQTNKMKLNKDNKQMKKQKEKCVNQKEWYILTLRLSPPHMSTSQFQLYVALQWLFPVDS